MGVAIISILAAEVSPSKWPIVIKLKSDVLVSAKYLGFVVLRFSPMYKSTSTVVPYAILLITSFMPSPLALLTIGNRLSYKYLTS